MSHSYAGLWARIKAFAADYLVISAYIVTLVVASLLTQSTAPGLLQPLFGNPWVGQLSGFILITLPVTLYFALSESSPRRATWGKRWQSLQVVRTTGEKVSRIRSLSRTLIKFIPWELAHTCIWQASDAGQENNPLILTGFILVWVLVGIYVLSLSMSKTKQSLYDRWTDTCVIRI